MSSESRTLKEKEHNEMLLKESMGRFILFPIQHNDIWELYKLAVSSFWVREEIDYSADRAQFETLTSDEQHFIKMVLAFFASSDCIVLENLNERLMSAVQLPEARCFYAFQGAIENIHSEVYAQLIETLVQDQTERNRLFNAIQEIPIIQKKANWALSHTKNPDVSFAELLVVFTCVEGIFFSGSFCSIFWLKKRGGICPAVCFSNELISRDEGLHTTFGCLLYNKLQNRLSQQAVHQIIKDAVEIETEFVCQSIPVELLGMNSALMSQYIRFVADRLSLMLGYEKIYGDLNPFEWMTGISLQGKSNFFEKRVSEYQKASVRKDGQTFTLDADF